MLNFSVTVTRNERISICKFGDLLCILISVHEGPLNLRRFRPRESKPGRVLVGAGCTSVTRDFPGCKLFSKKKPSN